MIESINLENHPNIKRMESGEAGHVTQKGNEVDVMMLAFYLLLVTSSTLTESALIHAKKLQMNAQSQQNLNVQAAELQWYSVPTLDIKHYTIRLTYSHKHAVNTPNGVETYTTYSYKTIRRTKTLNATVVQVAQTKNMQVAADRQILIDKLGVLQQVAQTKENGVNNINDEANQVIQSASLILNVLKQLTYEALLRKEPQ